VTPCSRSPAVFATQPGIFQLLWHHPLAKYLGALGVVLPVTVGCYYVYVQSWTLAYTYYAVVGQYEGITSQAEMSQFLAGFHGRDASWGVSGVAYLFFLMTMALNTWVLSGGIRQGIERAASWGMPVLIVLSVLLAIAETTAVRLIISTLPRIFTVCIIRMYPIHSS
jgi:neurotransmitter:Na+ symporter, NSS family